MKTCSLPLGRRLRLGSAGFSQGGVAQESHWEEYVLPKYWALHLYLYAGRITLDRKDQDFQPGFFSLTPPGKLHRIFRPKKGAHYYAHFYFEDGGESEQVVTPVLWDASGPSSRWVKSFSDIIFLLGDQPSRAGVRFWDFLWNISASPGTGSLGEMGGKVREAALYMERRLGEELSIPQIAEAVGISQNHLNRLFQKELGRTVLSHFRRRKMEVTRFLLENTSLGVKEIADRVGYRDLQRFNKVVREILGSSPRKLRR